MEEIFSIFYQLWYFGIFLLMFILNTAPILMPPTWIVLVSFRALDQTLHPLALAIVGASGAALGRFVLLRVSSYFSKFLSSERKSSLDKIQNYLQSKKLGYFGTSFVFAATPLPDNILFITYGLMRAKSIQIYCGYWLGRFLAYYVMLSVSDVVLTPFLQIFEERYIGVLVVDVASICMMILFASVNWNLLISEKKIHFVKPRFWKL
jgi:membrane protein DedA with SNARE-associated domain